ncbi:MAG: AraC family transcriptional regulator [Planctomycetes bacterium]|nr:AraC family transcriptional regulator [Planctomycetota bacterium]
MDERPAFTLRDQVGIVPLQAGLFVRREPGRHARRTLDSHEIIYVDRGRLAMREGDDRFVLDPGEAVVLRAGREHAGTEDYPTGLRIYWLHFRIRAGKGSGERLAVPRTVRVARPDRLTALLRRYLDDQAEGGIPGPVLGHLIMLMLHELALPAAKPGVANALARAANEVLATRFEQPLSTAGLAEELGCNPDHLGRCYHRMYGRSIIADLHIFRLRWARRRLMDSPDPVEAIARAAGFADVVYFRRIFRRAEGMAPLAFRRMHQRMHVNTD